MEGNNNIPAGWFNEVHDIREELVILNRRIAELLLLNPPTESSNSQNAQQRHPDNIRDSGPSINTRSPRRNTRSPRRNNGGKTRKRKSRKNKNK
jgi:hypothetical protein